MYIFMQKTLKIYKQKEMKITGFAKLSSLIKVDDIVVR